MNEKWFLMSPKHRTYAKERTVSPLDLVHKVSSTTINSSSKRRILNLTAPSSAIPKKSLTDTGNIIYSEDIPPPVVETKPVIIDGSISKKKRRQAAQKSLRIKVIQEWYRPHTIIDCPPLAASSC